MYGVYGGQEYKKKYKKKASNIARERQHCALTQTWWPHWQYASMPDGPPATIPIFLVLWVRRKKRSQTRMKGYKALSLASSFFIPFKFIHFFIIILLLLLLMLLMLLLLLLFLLMVRLQSKAKLRHSRARKTFMVARISVEIFYS